MDTIRVGVLGMGRGMTYARTYKTMPGATTVALCDRDRPRLEGAAASLEAPDVRLFTDYEEMLRQPDIDVVVVASDGTLHGQHVEMALNAGKHVLGEVPMDYALEECRRIVNAVERTGLQYMMAANPDYNRWVPTVRQWLQEGRFGDVVYCEAEYVHDVRRIYYRDETGKHFSAEQAKNNPQARRTWRSGVHPIQYITHSLGPLLLLLEDRCKTVSCLSTGAHTSPEDGNPDAEVAIMTTDKGRVIKILIAHTIAHPSYHWHHLMGTRGSFETKRGSAEKAVVYFEDEGGPQRWRPLAEEDLNAPLPEAARAAGHGGTDWCVADAFLTAIRENKRPPVDAYRAADYTLPGICAVQSAEQGGVPVVIPDFRKKSGM
jgi:predicted dehydrogenase